MAPHTGRAEGAGNDLLGRARDGFVRRQQSKGRVDLHVSLIV